MISVLQSGEIKRDGGQKFRFEESSFYQQKQNAPVRKPGPMRMGKSL
jgi:hypothetical protein